MTFKDFRFGRARQVGIGLIVTVFTSPRLLNIIKRKVMILPFSVEDLFCKFPMDNWDNNNNNNKENSEQVKLTADKSTVVKVSRREKYEKLRESDPTLPPPKLKVGMKCLYAKVNKFEGQSRESQGQGQESDISSF